MNAFMTRRSAKRAVADAEKQAQNARRQILLANQTMADAAAAMTAAQTLMARGTPAAGDEDAWAAAQTSLIERSAQLRPGLAIP